MIKSPVMESSLEGVFDESYERVIAPRERSEAFFTLFYQNFLGASPTVANKFRHTDMQRQQSMLEKSFYSLISFYASNHAEHLLEKIAISHNRSHLDIWPELYDVWLEQLIVTVRALDPEFNDRVELAWRLVLAPGITYLKFHYDKCPSGG